MQRTTAVLTANTRFGIESLLGKELERGILPMPSDPKEARQHALAFVRLAQTSAYPPARERYATLANTWLRLAAELERGHDLIDRRDESEPIRRTV